MRHRRRLGMAAGLHGLTALLCGLSGCAMLNSFLDPTTVGQFPREYREGGIHRVLTPRETPPGPPNATEPTPEDLVARYDDYRFGPGDVLLITIPDLRAGYQEQLQVEVSASGNVRIPELGMVKVTGLTEQELEQELRSRFREAEIMPDADVRVQAQLRRGRIFTIRGTVGRAGVYPIGDPDTRILDVIGQAQDIGGNVKKIYVIRRVEASGAAGRSPARPEGLLIEPPDEHEFTPAFFTAQGSAGRWLEPPAETAPADGPTRAELEEILAPRAQSPQGPTATQPALEPALPPIMFDPKTGELIARPPEAARPEAPARADAPPAEEPFDWEAVPELELEQRVIEIDVPALLNGDPRYNIVIRDRDVINVPVDTAVFYAMGEVNRPGVYAFNGRDVTIKQAIAMFGGFTPLAWPQRCEIVRHEPGTDKQITIPVNVDAIFAGLEPDVYLRDDDIINVGTHFVAPFLFVIRNSFRFTYGFGFVYDRNFADKDAYSSKVNPQILEQERRRARGLPF